MVGLLIAGITAWITVRLSLRRFRSERLWERKVQAYEKILESLHHLKSYCNEHIKSYEIGSSVGEEREKELYRKFKLAWGEINKYRDIGAFLVADSAVERLKLFEKEIQDSHVMSSFFELVDTQYGIVDDCIRDINKIARSDISIMK